MPRWIILKIRNFRQYFFVFYKIVTENIIFEFSFLTIVIYFLFASIKEPDKTDLAYVRDE